MIYAETHNGKLTGRWKNLPTAFGNWVEYADMEEFESDLAIDQQERRENLRREAR